MHRRSFLVAILASAVAPAVVRASSLMPIVPRYAPFLSNGALIGFDDLIEYKVTVPVLIKDYKAYWIGGGDSPLICPRLDIGSITKYFYTLPHAEFLIPKGKVQRVVADGVEFPLSNFTLDPDRGRASLHNLDLTPFGNRLPHLTFEIQPRSHLIEWRV